MRRRRPPRKAPKRAQARTLTIERLSLSGEGVAGSIRVPFALPGEVVEAEIRGGAGEPKAVLQRSEHRVPALCAHFGLPGDGCGGCTLQHLGGDKVRFLKESRLLDAVRRVYPDATIDAYVTSSPRSRRRARFAVDQHAAGFYRLGSRRIVPLTDCAVVSPRLFALLGPLRRMSGQLGTGFSAMVTESDTGLDVDLVGLPEDPGLEALERLAAFAGEEDLARLSLAGVPLAERRPPRIVFGGVPVTLPPAAFLQATSDGEAALVREVLDGMSGAHRVADLFSGLGTFALPISARAEVTAWDSAPDAITALNLAAQAAGRPLTGHVRDLFRQPLRPHELKDFSALVFDPPRAGGGEQATLIAAAAVPRVVAVSCEPRTLARDLGAFGAAYDLTRLVLVDQFGWSPHVEAVAVLRRR